MLWSNGRPPEPLTESVLHQTALLLGLKYWQGEPLKLDAVFYPEDAQVFENFPLPMSVALEHENTHERFGQEIAKLFSVRCHLKVGIVYSNLSTERMTVQIHLDRIRRIRDQIVDVKNRTSKISEDPTTEYLFLVGTEDPGRPENPSVTWYSLQFAAGMDAAAIMPDFKRIEPPGSLL